MPKMVLTAEYVFVNSVDLSSFTKKAEIAIQVDDKDVTTYASAGWKESIGGLKSGDIAFEFLQDYTVTTGLDAIMWPLLGTVVAFELRPTQAVRGTSNPAWTGNLLVKEWKPISGGVGDEATVSVQFPITGAVTRATA